MQSVDLAPDEKETFRQLFFNGPTWDGDIVSKAGRAGLMRRGYVERENGWTQLTSAGFVLAVRAGLGDDKESRANKIRREDNERQRVLCGCIEHFGSITIGPDDPAPRDIERTRHADGSVTFVVKSDNS